MGRHWFFCDVTSSIARLLAVRVMSVCLCRSVDVDYLLISDDDEDDGGWSRGGGAWPTAVRHKSRLVYVAGRPATLRCIVVGGRPAPAIRVRVAARRAAGPAAVDQRTSAVADTMTLRLSSRTAGDHGLRVERRATELSSRGRFIVDVDDDEAVVSCEASVDGFPPRLATATITVLCQ